MLGKTGTVLASLVILTLVPGSGARAQGGFWGGMAQGLRNGAEIGALNAQSAEAKQREAYAAAQAAVRKKVGALLAQGKCQEAQTLALQKGYIDIAQTAADFCARNTPQQQPVGNQAPPPGPARNADQAAPAVSALPPAAPTPGPAAVVGDASWQSTINPGGWRMLTMTADRSMVLFVQDVDAPRTPNLPRVWVRTEKLVPDGPGTLSTRAIWQADCQKHLVRMSSIQLWKERNMGGAPMYRPDQPSWGSVNEGTVLAAVFKSVCPAG